MKKAAIIIPALILSLGIFSQLSSRNMDGEDCPRFENRAENCGFPGFLLDSKRAAKDLNLTSEQTAKLKEISTKFKNEAKPYCDNMKTLHAKMEEIDSNEKSSLSDYESILKEMNSNHYQIQLLRVKYRIEIRGVLTKEQNDKLSKMHKGKGMRGQRYKD